MSKSLTAGRLLARNTIWNIVGEAAPLLIAVIAIPVLAHGLGTVRFGILLIVWVLIGYLSLFDLGVGRALTNLVAQKLGTRDEASLPPLIWTANILMVGVGVIGAVLLAACSHWLVYSILKIPNALKSESLISLYVLSAALPAVISSTGFRGVLEAYQRFDAANAVRIPIGVLSFAGPLAVLPFSHSLVPVVTALAAGRYAATLAYLIYGRAILPVMRSRFEWRSELIRPLLSFGGWMTVSNLVSPIMATMDRFFLGALVSMQAVAYYATPSEVINKTLIVPVALAGVLFPAFSTALASDISRSRQLYRRSQEIIALVMGVLSLLLIVFAKIGLKLWLGETFAENGALPLQILAVGGFANSMAQPPFALVQGAGRADWTGKMHLAELPFYLAAFWVLTQRFGIVGTAIAWSLRAIVDALVLTVLAHKLLYARTVEATSTPAVDSSAK